MVEGLAAETGGCLRFCVLETSKRAADFFRARKTFEEKDPCWRMATGVYEEPPGGADIIATGSGAKG